MLQQTEIDFFKDVKQLIDSKYPGMEEKFGLWKVHHHFDMEENEVLHETSDPATRESTLRIVKRENLPEHSFATSWKLTTQGPVVCSWCCDWQPRPI